MDIAVIRDVLVKQPFPPFVLTINDGRTFEIAHPDWILLHSGHVTVFGDGGNRVIHLEPILIASLELNEPPERPADSDPKPSSESNDS